jgi:hypothetical protein
MPADGDVHHWTPDELADAERGRQDLVATLREIDLTFLRGAEIRRVLRLAQREGLLPGLLQEIGFSDAPPWSGHGRITPVPGHRP